jgi:hypothetical protein
MDRWSNALYISRMASVQGFFTVTGNRTNAGSVSDPNSSAQLYMVELCEATLNILNVEP